MDSKSRNLDGIRQTEIREKYRDHRVIELTEDGRMTMRLAGLDKDGGPIRKQCTIKLHNVTSDMLFERLADGIQKHAKAVVLAWVLILCVSGVFAIHAGDVMSYNTDSMAPSDSESMIGSKIIHDNFPSSSVNESATPIIVIYFENEEEMESSIAFLQALNEASKTGAVEGLNGVSYMDPMVSETKDGILLAYMGMDPALSSGDVSEMTDELRSFIKDVKGDQEFTVDVYLTGAPVIAYDTEKNALDDISKIDPFTILMILILVGLFFRSFITSATPPLTIAAAFVVTMALIYGLGQFMNIFFITNMMILVSMMGAGCDYCIFIIARYREELRSGKTHDEAVHQSIVWAGESISISGAAVIIGFGAMTLCKYSLISTMGICLALGIIIALIAALTLIPAILQLVGDRVFWPTTIKEFSEGGKATRGWYAWFGKVGDRYFHKSVDISIKHAKAIVVVAIMLTVPSVYVMAESENSYDMVTAMVSGDSGKGMEYIIEYADQGMIMPNYSIIEYRGPIATVTKGQGALPGLLQWNANWSEKVSPSLEALYAKIQEDDNIAYADGPFVWAQMLHKIEERGITDTEAKLKFVRDNISEKAGIVFNQAVSQIKNIFHGKVDLLFEGPGKAITELLAELGFDFDWEKAVEDAKESGLTDPTEIVNAVLDELVKKYPDRKAQISLIIDGVRKAGITDEMIVYTGICPAVDYIMNVYTSSVGGDFVKNGSGNVSYVAVITATKSAAMSPISMGTIERTGDAVRDYVVQNPDMVIEKWDTGSAVVMYQVSEEVKSQFVMIEILVIVLIILLLFVVMRSYTIPLRSALTILMSVSWTLAVTHLLFVNVLGGEILWMAPILLLVICLGLGMDYDILLTTRIRENVTKGMSNEDAIRKAVVHTGSVITICGLIMGGAFGTLMISSIGILQQFGFALCFAILTDALIVRTYVVPAMMYLLGDLNWKGPGFKRKVRESDDQAD